MNNVERRETKYKTTMHSDEELKKKLQKNHIYVDITYFRKMREKIMEMDESVAKKIHNRSSRTHTLRYLF